MTEKTISITFGDAAENHAGMQLIGKTADSGISVESLRIAKERMESQGIECELIELHVEGDLPEEFHDGNEAAVLIVRDGIRKRLKVDPDELLEEHLALDPDTKALMRGRVVNKRARYNLCYADFSQEANIEEGKGTIVDFKDVPLLNRIRRHLPIVAWDMKTANLVAEMNLYYDISKTGIGMHGDTERKIVVCLRLGASMPLEFSWFHRFKPIGKRIPFLLHHGDIYIMSEKAVGSDWKSSSKYTLRHAAGCKKFLEIK